MSDSDNRSNSDTGPDAVGDAAPTPSQGGSMGGGLQRDIGKRDEERAAFEDAGEGVDPSITRPHKGDYPDGGNAPNLPNRDGTSGGRQLD